VSFRIGTNISAMAASRFAARAENELSHSLRAISSGSRIVDPGDDSAGYAISESLRAQALSLDQAKRNAQNANGIVQIAEGGLGEQSNILLRLRELAVQSASDTVGDEERGYLQSEFKQLSSEFDRIAQSTNYGSRKLLAGEGGDFQVHVGAQNSSHDMINFKLNANTSASELGVDGLSVADRGDAQSSIEQIEKATSQVIKARSGYGSLQSRLEHTVNHLDVQRENIVSARSNISDVDVAQEVSKMTAAKIQNEFAMSSIAQANSSATGALRLLA
jgi:flagellin